MWNFYKEMKIWLRTNLFGRKSRGFLLLMIKI